MSETARCCYFLAQISCGVLEVKKIFMWIGISVGALLVIAFIVLSVMAGGPKDAIYMVRYALPHMHRGNLKDDVCYAQPRTVSDRLAIANDFTKRFKYPLPFGVDDMQNAGNNAYAAWPERLYIIDENGKIAYRGGMGPFNYNPSEVRAWLASRYGEVKHPEAKPAPNDKEPEKKE